MRVAVAFVLAAILLGPVLPLAVEEPHRWDHPADARPHLILPAPGRPSWPASWSPGTPLPNPSPGQTSGTARVLVLFVRFTDVAPDPAHDSAYFDGLFNAAGPGARSMRAYFEEVSFGALTIQATVVATWWPAANTRAHYGADAANGIDDANGPIYRLVTEAVRLADPTVDFSTFDADADGVVDHLIVVHAGGAQEETGDADDIWSHRWAVLDADRTTPGSQTLIVDGVQVYGYIMMGEASPVGVAAHEFGHDLDLPDLYDTDGSSEGIGRWDLMAGGSWNGFPAGTSPAHLSAWSRAQLGWIAPTAVTTALVGASIPAIETSGTAYRLPISGTLGRQYFLVENRQPIGFDAGLPGGGLLIWHVDEGRVSNADDAWRLVDLEEADEAATGDRPTDPQDAWSSTAIGWGPETTPNSRAHGGATTGWRVRDISASGDPMTATIAREVQRDVAITEIRGPPQVAVGATANVSVVVRNDGAVAEAVTLTARVHRDRFDGTAVVLERTVDVGSVPPQTSVPVDLSFPVASVGRYLVHATAPLAGDEIPTNNERIAHVNGNRFAFREDVEAGPGGWALDGTPDDPHRWRIVADSEADGGSVSPTHAWRFGYVPTLLPNLFPPRWHALASPAIAVPGPPVHLIFYHRYDLWGRTVDALPVNLSETDVAVVEVSVDGSAWREAARFTGRDLAWRGVSLDLSADIPGPASLRVRFNASADVMPDSGGWWIDDVAVAERGLGRGVVFLGSPGPYAAPAVGPARADVKVANVGDFEDSVVLGAAVPGQGWSARIESNGGAGPVAGHRVRLAPDQDAVLRILVDVPRGAAAGTQTVTITATSEADGSASAALGLRIAVGNPSPFEDPLVLLLAGASGAAVVVALAAVAIRRRRRRPPT